MSDKKTIKIDRVNLSPYRGELSPEDVAKGMECAIENSKRLANDARILFDAESYPSSCALAILSIEESGKLSILRRMALGGDSKTVKAMWKKFSSHTDKNFMWMFLGMVSSGARKLDDFRKLFDKSNANLLNNIKQISLYSGCYGKKHWSNPEEVIDRDLSIFLLETAELLASSEKNYTSIRAVQLWVEYLQPVWGTDFESQANALAEWHKALIEEGLAEEGKFSMDEFVKNGVVMALDKEKDE
jgi:AbiV family abortive infection protein